jgi:hypothetical protein
LLGSSGSPSAFTRPHSQPMAAIDLNRQQQPGQGQQQPGHGTPKRSAVGGAADPHVYGSEG